MCSRANEVGRPEDERGREGEIKERGREGERERGPLNQMKELGGSAICIMAFINQKTNLPFLNLGGGGGGIHSEDGDSEDTHHPPPPLPTPPRCQKVTTFHKWAQFCSREVGRKEV